MTAPVLALPVAPTVPNCPFCGQPNGQTGKPLPTIVIFDDGTIEQCHDVCLAAATRRRAERSVHDHDDTVPECAVCGEPYRGGHTIYLTEGFWSAEGDDGHLYRPARPFPSPHWPHHLISGAA